MSKGLNGRKKVPSTCVTGVWRALKLKKQFRASTLVPSVGRMKVPTFLIEDMRKNGKIYWVECVPAFYQKGKTIHMVTPDDVQFDAPQRRGIKG